MQLLFGRVPSQTGELVCFDLVWCESQEDEPQGGGRPGEFTSPRGDAGRMPIVPFLVGFLRIAYPRKMTHVPTHSKKMSVSSLMQIA